MVSLRGPALALALTACAAQTDPPIAPPSTERRCAYGELELDDVTCQPPGVPPERCGMGFEPDGALGCNAILPADACADGLMAIPGEISCREVAPCGRGQWGDIPVDSTTQHVDGSSTGTDADGSAARPWTTVTQAIAAAPSGGLVAIAAGTYQEDLRTLNRPVRLWGRCPSMVTLAGAGTASQTVLVRGGADGTELRDLSITGADLGVAVSGAQGVLLDRVRVHDVLLAGLEAVDILGTTRVEVRRSLVERSRALGVHGGGAGVLIEQSVIRDILDDHPSSAPAGYGLSGEASPTTGTATTFEVRRTIVERATRVTVQLLGSNAVMDEALVRDGRAAADGNWGRGMSVEPMPETFARSSLVMRTSVVERNPDAGILLAGSDATIEDTVVRDTFVRPSDGIFGQGITAQLNYPVGGVPQGEPASLTVRRSVIAASHEVGLVVFGSQATLESVWIRDTQPNAVGQSTGAAAHPELGLRPSFTARDSLIERTPSGALRLEGADAMLDNVGIIDTTSGPDGLYGDGVDSFLWTQLDVTNSRIANSARAGVASFGATVRIASTLLECNQIPLTQQDFVDATSAFEDAGANVCRCGDVTEPCKVIRADLATPPPPFPPSGM